MRLSYRVGVILALAYIASYLYLGWLVIPNFNRINLLARWVPAITCGLLYIAMFIYALIEIAKANQPKSWKTMWLVLCCLGLIAGGVTLLPYYFAGRWKLCPTLFQKRINDI